MKCKIILIRILNWSTFDTFDKYNLNFNIKYLLHSLIMNDKKISIGTI